VILDIVANAALYSGTHEAVDRALALLGTVPWMKLEDGRHELAEGVFALLSSYVTGSPRESRFEGHRQHADIQLLLQGQETIYWAPAADLEVGEEYDPAGDILYFREPSAPSGEPSAPGAAVDAALTPVAGRPGLFLLLYPTDAHKPGRLRGSPREVRKAVLKVRL
jgi:biofilm protein TabA